ncbi:MAG TPA: hypothetical protein VF032_19535 [Thermoleophilaceae bacterium]
MTVSQLAAGSFDQNDFRQCVIWDIGSGNADWSSGAIRTEQIQIQPTLVEHWSIIGWSIRLDIGFLQAFGPVWGRLGNLWAGLLVDSALHNAGGAIAGGVGNNSPTQQPGAVALPQDLSTFSKIWDGSTDAISQVGKAGNLFPGIGISGRTLGAPVGTTFMLPSPVDISPGTLLQMVLILTPSLSAGGLMILIQNAGFTVLYDTGK